jgi:hypothetical protein
MQHTVLGYQVSEAPTDPIGGELMRVWVDRDGRGNRGTGCDVDGHLMTGQEPGPDGASELTGKEGGKNRHKKQKNGEKNRHENNG